jgi:hypothetical protein
MNTNRLEDIMSAIRVFQKQVVTGRASANSELGRCFPQLREKWLKKARQREKAVARLAKLLCKECDRLKAHYQ